MPQVSEKDICGIVYHAHIKRKKANKNIKNDEKNVDMRFIYAMI